MTRRGRILVALAAVALAAYAALGAAATVHHERSIRNVFDEMALEGPMTKPQLPFPWIRGTMGFPPDFRWEPGTGDKWVPEPEVRSETFAYAGDLGRPWDGMECPHATFPVSGAFVSVRSDGIVTGGCNTEDGMTEGGLAFTARFYWSYDPATRTLSWEQYLTTYEPDKIDRSKSSEYNGQFYHSLAREEWLAATGVDGARLDAWADRALGLGIRGWLSQNAGRTRFSAADLGDFNLAEDNRERLQAFLDSLGDEGPEQ
ncbi:hypothetical protein [Olsenella profusa]|uniref:Uncharacterized protein n=1 Tax=Olsenella profusa F0195 TaxID=1125712 RepID=U2TQS7_9ACTN|nr:hypothetical protein [Olsenella profusa]ERL08478.1 hypothetical protein HMPREF1316_1984 [Olsenella profusa F0195]